MAAQPDPLFTGLAGGRFFRLTSASFSTGKLVLITNSVARR